MVLPQANPAEYGGINKLCDAARAAGYEA
jgi:hypothetical protein